MYDRVTFRRKFFIALAAAASLILGAVVTWAAFPAAPQGSENFAPPARKSASHLVLHDVRFDSSGKLDDGSQAELDEAADFLKQNPDATVSVDQHGIADPNAACGLTPAQTRTVARYIEAGGVPATRLILCQATPSSNSQQE